MLLHYVLEVTWSLQSYWPVAYLHAFLGSHMIQKCALIGWLYQGQIPCDVIRLAQEAMCGIVALYHFANFTLILVSMALYIHLGRQTYNR